jgi:hypothetical protein
MANMMFLIDFAIRISFSETIRKKMLLFHCKKKTKDMKIKVDEESPMKT